MRKIYTIYSEYTPNPNVLKFVSNIDLFKSTKESMTDSFFTSKIAEKCYQKGLLVVHTGRESIKIGPPLTIPTEALIEGISVISESITEVLRE